MEHYKAMVPKFKKQWMKALRSKKFTKATGALRRAKGDGDGFCCLGVLCEITGNITRGRWTPDPDDTTGKGYGFDGTYGVLPLSVMRLTYVDSNAQTSLASKNDHGWSFDKIADWIEKNL